MRIAIVNPALATPTGGERQALMLAIELQRLGHEVDVYTSHFDQANCFPELVDQVSVINVPYPWSYTPYPFNHLLPYYVKWLGMRKIGKVLSGGGYDVINCHNFPSEWAVHYSRKRCRTPSVWMCNEPPFWFFMEEERRGPRMADWPLFEVLDRRAVRSVDRIAVLSRLMGRVVQETYGRDFSVVRSGVDAARFEGSDGAAFRRKHGLADELLLLQVGQYSPYKRQEDSIRALGRVARVRKDVRLAFIGTETGYKERLIDEARSCGVEKDVLFLGPLPDDELAQAYSACDVFLFPSRQSWSLVTTEAMAGGKPAIVSDQCGVMEIIANGENGYIFPHGDAGALAGILENLLADKDLRARVGRNARTFVAEQLTWPHYARQMEEILAGAASR